MFPGNAAGSSDKDTIKVKALVWYVLKASDRDG
jgi:hypothetical protein